MAKSKSATKGHNSTVSGQQLLGFIERVERLKEEKQAIQDDIKMVFAEAKQAGFDAKVMNNIIKRRAANPHDVEEFEALLDMYQSAIGMKTDLPLFRYFQSLDDKAGSENLVSVIEPLVPENGEIIIKTGKNPIRVWRDKKGQVFNEPWSPPQPTSFVANQVLQARSPQPVPPPDVDEKEAKTLGGEYYQDNKPITANPFPWDDKRRAKFDAGWREASGTDGMGED